MIYIDFDHVTKEDLKDQGHINDGTAAASKYAPSTSSSRAADTYDGGGGGRHGATAPSSSAASSLDKHKAAGRATIIRRERAR